MDYNAAFFGLYENVLKTLLIELPNTEAIRIFTTIMEMGLKKAYDASGFAQGDVQDFIRIVSERDHSVGLPVEIRALSSTQICYRFLMDPFPNMQGMISHEVLDRTYMAFKVRYLLGPHWTYKNIKHLWKGDAYTEFLLEA
jgi:hypothetical protein